MIGVISLVVPCYNEEQTIDIFMTEIEKVSKVLADRYHETVELIFIDDGSSDNTLEIIKGYDVKYISFSRNFGKEAGLYAGLQAAKGDYVAVMDVDLQDPPELLLEMYEILTTEKQYDCAAARRYTRKGEPPVRSFFAKCFYKLINVLSKTEIVDGARDFRLMTRRMVDAILTVNERNRFSKGIFGWVGFNTKWLKYENRERSKGSTKWSFWKLFIYSLDGITSYSTAPLAISSFMGISMFFVALIMITVFLVKTLVWGDPVAGYPSLVCIILLVSGVQLFCIGIVGQYLAKLYIEAKDRPVYIVRESNV